MLANLIDEYITEKRAESIRTGDKFRVSDAGRCHLMRYWKRQGRPPTDEHDARTYRIFEVGNVFHVWLQNLLEKKGILVEKEFRVEDEHRIGHVDAIIQTEQGLILYDFKTVHSRKFHYLRNGDEDRHYKYQIATYAMMLPFGVADTRIAYISKDDLHIEEVSVDINEISQAVMNDWSTLIQSWIEQKEPEPNPENWECKYCIYRTACVRKEAT